MEQARGHVQADEISRVGAPHVESDVRTPEERSILALHQSAGNRAVATLLLEGRRRPGRPRATEAPGRRPRPAQRQEERGAGPSDYTPPPMLWPMEAEGERNEPCFAPDAQRAIGVGNLLADTAASTLSAAAPDLEGAVQDMEAALSSWEGATGAEPGMAMLTDAKETLGRAGARVSIYVTPVADMLQNLTTGTRAAAGEAREASGMTREREATGYRAPDEETSEPCFDTRQQALIAEGATLAEVAAAELARRPPDYRRVLRIIDGAAEKLGTIGGSQPGQAKLSSAVASLDRMGDVVNAYLTPVEKVVSEAAADIREASAAAFAAAEAAKPPPERPGEEVVPGEEGGGYAPPEQ